MQWDQPQHVFQAKHYKVCTIYLSSLPLSSSPSLPPIQVDSAWSSGDLAGASMASTRAKQLSIVGIICGSIMAGVVGVFIIATVVWAATHDHDDSHDIHHDTKQ